MGNGAYSAYLHPEGESLLWKSRCCEITGDVCHCPVDQVCDAGLRLYKTIKHQIALSITQCLSVIIKKSLTLITFCIQTCCLILSCLVKELIYFSQKAIHGFCFKNR